MGIDPDQPISAEPIGPFFRPSTGEILVVRRPRVPGYPIEVRVQWASSGEGREALNELLGGVLVLELDRLAEAALAGAPHRLGPLQEFGDRPGWTIESRPSEAPDRYRIQKDDDPQINEGPRLDLLLALELALRAALGPMSAAESTPPWVARARSTHARLRLLLHGVDVFEFQSPSEPDRPSA